MRLFRLEGIEDRVLVTLALLVIALYVYVLATEASNIRRELTGIRYRLDTPEEPEPEE